jgi:hypothetical protein
MKLNLDEGARHAFRDVIYLTKQHINIREDNTMEEMVEITKEAYEKLLENSEFLSCLQAAGVDNWDGYEYAQDMMNGDI